MLEPIAERAKRSGLDLHDNIASAYNAAIRPLGSYPAPSKMPNTAPDEYRACAIQAQW